MTLNKQDNSFTVAQERGELLPPSKLMGLRTGEFAGQFADNLGQSFEFRKFKANIANEREIIQSNRKIPKFNDLSNDIFKQFKDDFDWPTDDRGPLPFDQLNPKVQQSYKEKLLKLHVKRIKQDMLLLVQEEIADFNLTIDSLTIWSDAN